MLNARMLVGSHDILFVTLDALRFDVACDALESGLTPRLAGLLPGRKWELRHSPGSFTYAAHQAFFAGFLPTPTTPGPHPRLFATTFEGSESITEETCVLDAPDIVGGLAGRGYRTVCIGGVGFFNKRTPLSAVLPGMFQESYWCKEFGVTCPESTRHQVDRGCAIVEEMPSTRRLFLFLNVSAMHQPNCIFAEGAAEDSPETQAAALAYVDRHLPRLIGCMRARSPLLIILCSDHGTAYGEDGHRGHRISHPVVWNVPYAELVQPRCPGGRP
jgi:hypothetical protein